MKSFKLFLLKEYYDRSIENEAMIVLQKVIDMVDTGHVDYSDKSVKINVGNLVKDTKYNKLNIFILKGNPSIKIGKHDDGHHTIFIYSKELPKREEIDSFLLKKENTSKFKDIFKKFFDSSALDSVPQDLETSDYEKSNQINTVQAFEKQYQIMAKKLDDLYSEYHTARDELDKQAEDIGDDVGHKEVLSMSIAKLKKEYLGNSDTDFKKKAIDAFGSNLYKLLTPEFKAKLDSRLSDYYESKIK